MLRGAGCGTGALEFCVAGCATARAQEISSIVSLMQPRVLQRLGGSDRTLRLALLVQHSSRPADPEIAWLILPIAREGQGIPRAPLLLA